MMTFTYALPGILLLLLAVSIIERIPRFAFAKRWLHRNFIWVILVVAYAGIVRDFTYFFWDH